MLNLAVFSAALLTIPYAANHIYAWLLGHRVGFGTGSHSPVWTWTWVLFIAGAVFAYAVVMPLIIVLSGHEQHIVAAT